jgi:UDP-glucose 4-epimerase
VFGYVRAVKVLLAGGAGFIGSTVASACLDSGITPVILDNLTTGRAEFVRDRIFYQGDIADGALVDKIFGDHPDITAVVHLAAMIVVPDSVAEPLRYYRENVARTIEFTEHVVRNGCPRLLFSSSAAIYRPGDDLSVDEDSPLDPLNPYARSKVMVEQMLADCTHAYDLRVLSLRYFNPVGADPQLRTGLQLARPSHLLGKLLTAVELDEEFELTGVDWPTRDGSAIRDFIHVWDLAEAHVAALRRFDEAFDSGAVYQVINIATGSGTTVREFVAAFREVSDAPLRVRETGPRPGDGTGCYSRSDRARELLGWQARFSVADGIRDSIRWAAVRRERLGA